MVIALSDLGHLPIDLCRDCRSVLLGTRNSVVGYRRHRITIIVARFTVSMTPPNATTKTRV